MSLLDRVRDLVTHPPEGEAWDDQGVEDVAALATSLAAAWDAEPTDHRPAASRAATLGAFAAMTTQRVEPSQDAAGRAFPPAVAAPGIRRGGRRPAFILVTAGFLLVISLGTVVASAPGGPLYDARVAAEELLLPPGVDDRAMAQVERLQARVAEAEGAAERGDTAGVSAALREYARIATEAAGAPVADPATLARLAAEVRAQFDIISRIGAADPALEAVHEQVRLAVRALLSVFDEPGDGAEPGAGPGPSTSSEPSPVATAAPRGTAPGPSASPEPSPWASARPRDSVPPGTPGGTGGPSTSASPRASAAPGGQASSPSPRASSQPSPGGGGGSGPGSSGGGSGSTPRPAGGGVPGQGPNGSSSSGGVESGPAPPSGGKQ